MRRIMQKIHVFFDFDGTLANTNTYWRRLSMLAYAELGYHVTEEQFIRARSNWFLPYLPPAKKEITTRVREYDTEARRIEGLEQKVITNFEDTIKTLDLLSKRDCMLYIVSDAPSGTGYLTVEKLMPNHCFEKIIFDAEKSMLTEIKGTSFNAHDELWVIGDAEPDRLFARNLGAKYINVDDGPNSRLDAAYKILRDSFQDWLY